MGSEVAQQHEPVVEKGAPTKQPSFNVDLSNSTDAKSISGFNPLCEVGPSGKAPEISMQDIRKLTDDGKPSDILGPGARRDGITLPATRIVDGDNVLADGVSKPAKPGDVSAVPPVAEAPKLNQNTLDAGKVGKTEGYYQVADRLMGPGFNHNERKEFTNALRDAWKSQPGFENANHLHRGDQLLTQNNMDSVLNSVKDEGLRGRIRERLMSGEAKPPSSEPADNKHRDHTPRKRGEVPPQVEPDRTKGDQAPRKELPPEREKPPETRGRDRRSTPERDSRPPQITPKEDRFRDPSASYDRDTVSPQGKVKSAFERTYEVNDEFKGLTSVYGSGRTTASGLPFDKYQMTAASKEFPFGTVLKVTNPDTGLVARVVVNDHGPFAGKMVDRPDGTQTHARVLDLSVGAANAIGMGNTVKNLQIAVESIPEQGKWGESRRNIHGDYRKSVVAKINELSRRRG